MIPTGEWNLRTAEGRGEATGYSTGHWKALKNTKYFILVPEITI